MNERVQALKARLKVDEFPICTEKVRLVTESMRQTEGEPLIVRRARQQHTSWIIELFFI